MINAIMRFIVKKVFLIIALLGWISSAFSQNTESLKVALVHKIANCVIWRTDTSSYFTIGVLSNNQNLHFKFEELSKIAKINKKNIKVFNFSDKSNLKQVHLLFVDQENNESILNINQIINPWNTLLVTDENTKPGEIMINLKTDNKNGLLSFEYNRANILFAGLELTEELVLLKGTEIEIRDLYLRAKKLWDEQKRKADSLETISKYQELNLLTQKDSIVAIKKQMAENEFTIQNQLKVISSKDSILNSLNSDIKEQQSEIDKNRLELNKFKIESNNYISQIVNYQAEVKGQKRLSDSLAVDISRKKKELDKRKEALGEKEQIIKKQVTWLTVSILIITIVIGLVIIIFRAYIANKKAREKIAEQKEELQSVLEKLQNTQQQLIQSEKMASLGILVAGIAHEINNPVNFINSGIAGVEKVVNKIILLNQELNKLNSSDPSEGLRKIIELKNKLQLQNSIDLLPEIIKNIKLGIDRTISIVEGLRLYTRVDMEVKSMNDINQIIDTSLLLLKPKIKDRIEVKTTYYDLPLIPVFPAKLSQVFMNILSNAIDSIIEDKSPDKRSEIHIQTSMEDDKILIEFSDSGRGIPNENLNKLFDPFFTTKQVGKGTGLGLSISYGIITEHNGKITAKNNKDKGATFSIELPVR